MQHRRSIRLPGYDYTQPGAYFITLVTYQRLPLLAEIHDQSVVLKPAGLIAAHEWELLPNRFPHLVIDQMIVMPNHIHGILVLESQPSSLAQNKVHHEQFGHANPGSMPTIIGAYKSKVAWCIHNLERAPSRKIWQRNYYEHIIRSPAEWEQIRQYIIANPVRWAQDPDNPDR